VETLLVPENYQIYYASNGAEALASLDTFNPDLILLDVLMPGMDGLEVCKRLKLMRKWRSVPIIMLTALSGKTAIADCLEAGADDFIRKPVNGLELRARVKSMLRIKKQFDRIESFTKLQQNKISGLETNLSELGIDLAVGFANELSAPLTNISDRLKDLSRKSDSINDSELLNLVNSAQQSTLDLERLNNKFWIYLELALEKNQFDNHEACNVKLIIEQICIVQSQYFNTRSNLKLDLESAKIVVTSQHCEWIVKELLDNACQSIDATSMVNIHGKAIGRLFHLEINYPISHELVNIEEQELALSFKIVKKIVGIYDGMFSLSTAIDLDAPTETYRTTVKISLPLA
jgi:two-component system, sensor histidine kinase and response regulator